MKQRGLGENDKEDSEPSSSIDTRKVGTSAGAMRRHADRVDAEAKKIHLQSVVLKIRRLLSFRRRKNTNSLDGAKAEGIQRQRSRDKLRGLFSPHLRSKTDTWVEADVGVVTPSNRDLLHQIPHGSTYSDKSTQLQHIESTSDSSHQRSAKSSVEDINRSDATDIPSPIPDHRIVETVGGVDNDIIIHPENSSPGLVFTKSPTQTTTTTTAAAAATTTATTTQTLHNTGPGFVHERVTSTPNFDQYKLETEFCDNHVVHTTYKWGLSERLWEKSTWKQDREIGRGAFGNVWLQREQGGRQLRAVKSLLRGTLSKAGFSQELLALVKLKDYDYLFVEFHGWYEDTDHIFLVMEYIEYGDLGGYISQDPRKTAKTEVKEIIRQILEGLKVLHKKEICHRDLKPQNILIACYDPIWVKIADFGISKRVKNTVVRTMMCGTDGYIAPELLGFFPKNSHTRNLLGPALDIWSLGSLVHELLTCKTPFATYDEDEELITGVIESQPEGGIDMASLYGYCNGNIEFPTEVLKDSQASEEEIAFVKDLLAPNPKDRPTAASALRNPWLKKNKYTSDWYENLKSELSLLGVKLNPEADDSILIRQARKINIFQLLPTSVKEKVPDLLQEAARKGCNVVISKLFESPSNVLELMDSLARGSLFQLAVEAEQLETIKILLDYKVDINTHIENLSVLQWAVKAGHINTVILLLENEPDDSINCQNAFQFAVKSGQTDLVKVFLRRNTEIHTKAGFNDEGHTALQAAARGGHLEIWRLLDSEANSDGNRSKKGDHISLQMAAKGGNIEIVKLLLDSYADVNGAIQSNEGRTALQAASENGHIDIVRLLVDNKANVNAAAAPSGGRTALQAAAEGGYVDIVRLLLDNEANVNAAAAAGRRGLTALQAAVKSGNLTIVELLLEYNADVNATASNRGGMPLQAAENEENGDIFQLDQNENENIFQFDEEIIALEIRDQKIPEIAAYIGEYGKDQTPLQAAAEKGYTDIVKLLLDNDVNVNATTEFVGGRTALQAAVENGHLDIVKLLLDNHADTNIAPEWTGSRTALQAAAENGNFDIAKLLLENYADVNAATELNRNRTALQMAAEKGHFHIVKLLLDSHANVNATTKFGQGRTALQVAAENRHFKNSKSPRFSYTDTNIATKWDRSRTALQAAAENGHFDIVKILLDNKADVNAPAAPDGGRTALQAAAENNHLEIVKLLLEKNADVNALAAERDGLTALAAGWKSNNESLIKALDHASVLGIQPKIVPPRRNPGPTSDPSNQRNTLNRPAARREAEITLPVPIVQTGQNILSRQGSGTDNYM